MEAGPDRLVFSEWVKFSLQLAIEDEVTRRNLVSLMFGYIGKVNHSYRDYQHVLKYKRMVIKDDPDMRALDLAMEGNNQDNEEEEQWDDGGNGGG